MPGGARPVRSEVETQIGVSSPGLALQSGPASDSEAYFACLAISMMQRDLPALVPVPVC